MVESDIVLLYIQSRVWGIINAVGPSVAIVVKPGFYAKPSTHHMHDPGSIVPHIRPKVLIHNQMLRI
jgi:hypothetical protein